jgi:hypothetical protein
MSTTDIVASEQIEQRIVSLRETRVMLDQDLAVLYGVPTKALIQAVKRNADRFPDDFMFQLSREEFGILRSQTVTSSWGGRRYPPYAFTEQGIAMLSAVLQSPRAVAVSIEIVRVFVRLRKLLSTHDALARKLSDLETRLTDHDEKFVVVFDVIRQLIEEDRQSRRKPAMGFHTEAQPPRNVRKRARSKAK